MIECCDKSVKNVNTLCGHTHIEICGHTHTHTHTHIEIFLVLNPVISVMINRFKVFTVWSKGIWMVGLFAMLPRRRNTLMICTVADLAQSISIGDSLEMKCVLLGLSRGATDSSPSGRHICSTFGSVPLSLSLKTWNSFPFNLVSSLRDFCVG